VPLRAITFDLDGTLVDTLADITRAVNHSLAGGGLPPRRPEEIASFLGRGVEYLIERAIGRPGHHFFPEALQEYIEFRRKRPAELCRLYPGVKETLERLRALPLAVLSNGREEMARTIVGKLGVAQYFRSVRGGDWAARRKPSPLPLLELSEEFGAPPAACLMVGDMPVDIAAGKAAGFGVCAVTYGYGAREDLAAAGANRFIDSFPELLKIVF